LNDHLDLEWGRNRLHILGALFMDGGVMRELLTLLGVGVWLVSGVSMAQTIPKENLKIEALEQLQKKLAERDKAEVSPLIETNLSTSRTLTFAEIETLYVDGKITARQFQSYVNALRSAPAPVSQANPKGVHEKALDVLRQHEPNPAKNPAPGPAVTLNQIEQSPPPPLSPAEVQIAEDFDVIVDKMETLIKSKEAREKIQAEQLNPEILNDPGKTKSKRERLNDLLRLHVYGKLTKEEYDIKRTEILSEPE
jgi:hypothetical protein